MEWLTAIKESITYIEEHLCEIRGPEEVAQHVYMSVMYLQRGFQVMTGMTIGEYIRNRKMYLAAQDLVNTSRKVIDIALDYGYETPESFTKAFSRFHGASPMEVRKDRSLMKSFLPLRINLIVQGGSKMDYAVEKMEAFRLIGFEKDFRYDSSYREIPQFWQEWSRQYEQLMKTGKPQNEAEQAIVQNRIGEYALCMDDIGDGEKFRYFIAGHYIGGAVPEGLTLVDLPETAWAKFRCIGPLPEALQTVNSQIWNEWLPGNKTYELSGQFNIEWYSIAGNGNGPEYQSAIWIPVKIK